MKRYIYTMVFAAMCLLSCKKDKLTLFENPSDIYFLDIANTVGDAVPKDSVFVTFGYMTDQVTDSILVIPIGVTGKPTAADRSFDLQVDESSGMKEGLHFELDHANLIIPANAIKTNVLLKLKRVADLKTRRLSLKLNLVANENFLTNMKTHWINKGASGYVLNFTQFKITVDDVVGKPPFWQTSISETYLGPYSQKKLQLLIMLLGLDVKTITDPNFNATGGVLQLWKNFTNAFLLEEKGKGIYYYEEDGVTPIKMGL